MKYRMVLNTKLYKILLFFYAAFLLLNCGCAPRDQWYKLGIGKTSFKIPPRWLLTDPYTDNDVYWNYLWFRYFPPKDCRMALLKSCPADQNQFFAIIGPKEPIQSAIDRNISNYDDNPSTIFIGSHIFTTLDGIAVTVYTAETEPYGMDNEKITHLIGFAEFGDKMFLINGGGRSARFDIEIVEDFIESLTLGRN